jgi:hypothetical protein
MAGKPYIRKSNKSNDLRRPSDSTASASTERQSTNVVAKRDKNLISRSLGCHIGQLATVVSAGRRSAQQTQVDRFGGLAILRRPRA